MAGTGPCARADIAHRSTLFDQVAHAMSESGWLLVALLFGALAAIGWIKREMWIRRRRQQQRKREG
jgi:hypothetical protein